MQWAHGVHLNCSARRMRVTASDIYSLHISTHYMRVCAISYGLVSSGLHALSLYPTPFSADLSGETESSVSRDCSRNLLFQVAHPTICEVQVELGLLCFHKPACVTRVCYCSRQYRYEPSPEFPLASPCSGIDHHLSGPNRYALTQIFHK